MLKSIDGKTLRTMPPRDSRRCDAPVNGVTRANLSPLVFPDVLQVYRRKPPNSLHAPLKKVRRLLHDP